ncbi:MAG: hypothetical protein GY786_01265 [Proteobacteria bacterium]|nr:hypothetical protein [Pseudomonadota bacterium]
MNKHNLYIIAFSIFVALGIVLGIPTEVVKDRLLSLLLFFLASFAFGHSLLPVFIGRYGWFIEIPFFTGDCERAENPVLFWGGIFIRFAVSLALFYVGAMATFIA